MSISPPHPRSDVDDVGHREDRAHREVDIFIDRKLQDRHAWRDGYRADLGC